MGKVSLEGMDFEEFWEIHMEETIFANGVMAKRKELYVEECLRDFKELARKAWEKKV